MGWKSAARSRVRGHRVATAPAPRPAKLGRATGKVVLIGASTGGVEALKEVLMGLPSDCPPILVTQHMPARFTTAFANRLNKDCPMKVSEASHNEIIEPGHVYIAPAGRHLTLRRNATGQVLTYLDVRPLDTPHRPSVDTLFQSAADVYGARVLGIVMTGMGSDGREGAAWIKAKGGMVLTESEASCVVYGMPRSIVEAGLSDGEVLLDRMADAVLERL